MAWASTYKPNKGMPIIDARISMLETGLQLSGFRSCFSWHVEYVAISKSPEAL